MCARVQDCRCRAGYSRVQGGRGIIPGREILRCSTAVRYGWVAREARDERTARYAQQAHGRCAASGIQYYSKKRIKSK